jgi:hypothetical protein
MGEKARRAEPKKKAAKTVSATSPVPKRASATKAGAKKPRATKTAEKASGRR